jgi:hypothetical protein
LRKVEVEVEVEVEIEVADIIPTYKDPGGPMLTKKCNLQNRPKMEKNEILFWHFWIRN